MTVHGTGLPRSARPSHSARWLIHTAVRLLPPGPTRVRYDRELTAELYGMTLGRQFRHALGVLCSMGALRTAIAGAPPSMAESVTVAVARKPLICRLNIRHRWKREHAEDGSLYWRCARCGRDWDERNLGSTPFA
jgi:hypothetical protein